MPNLTLTQAHHTGVTIHGLASRSAPGAAGLSAGAIAGIATAASMVLFLILVGPLMVFLAKRQQRRHAAECPLSSLSFAEHGQLPQDVEVNIPKTLRKKSTVSEGAAYLGMEDAGSEGSEGGYGDMRAARHLSMPSFPPARSHPRSFSMRSSFPGGILGNGGNDGSTNEGRSHGSTSGEGERTYRSPEKHRGRAIYQNRRKTSWIDEDALHGPRVSPKKNTTKKSRWFTGNGLTRTLSRHLSFRGHRAPELARSPTLPYTETSQRAELAGGSLAQSPEGQRIRSTENSRGMHESRAEIQTVPRFPVRQPLPQGGSSNPQIMGPRPQRAPIPIAALPNPQFHNNAALNAAQQLAGRARVPYVDLGANGQRRPELQQGNTDAELQAILRRTAERLQDGTPSTRRQTMMMMPTSFSSSGLPEQSRQGSNQENEHGRGYTHSDDMPPSPAKSQKSAPAELEGCSPIIHHDPPQSGPAPWQTHRRTHSRQISISQVSQISRVSMLSEPDILAATPSRRVSQGDGLHTALSSPNRMSQKTPSYPQQATLQRSYSSVSEQSSALSTVYSEEEGTPSILRLENYQRGEDRVNGTAMSGTSQAGENFYNAQRRGDTDVGNDERRQEAEGYTQINQGPRPSHTRNGTLGQISPSSTRGQVEFAFVREDGITQRMDRSSPTAASTFMLNAHQVTTDDPFTTCKTPTRSSPQRLSQVFSPLPAELPGDTTNNFADTAERASGTPTPSRSRKRVLPPPHRLKPGTSSPTPADEYYAQFQVQPPSQEASPATSESVLSSVYDNYQYSHYSDSIEGSQALARLSSTTMLTVPPSEASPTKSRWDEEISPATSTESRADDCGMEGNPGGFRSAHECLNTAVSGASINAHAVSPLVPSAMENSSMGMRYTVEDELRRSQPIRDISLGGVSNFSGESAYSQDEDGQDRLAPLIPFPGRHAMRVTSAVAELRRMNSQVSCVSGYSTATTNVGGDMEITSPTLPALRGGGFSPGKKGAGGGTRNYLSLGGHLNQRNGEGQYDSAESGKYDTGSGGNGKEDEKTTMAVGITGRTSVRSRHTSTKDEITIPKRSMRRSRGSTVAESFEQDLDRARQILRESRGYNLQAISEVSNKMVA
ncbi:hypothetical protein F5B18DRAFT_73555 [Nemania serpens]|nr:hypothetical protein F5B18DRAFT_73555 [Nemania serpens]